MDQNHNHLEIFLPQDCSLPFEYKGAMYLSIEHAYQCEKFPKHPKYTDMIRQCKTPLMAKQLGKMQLRYVYSWHGPNNQIIHKFKKIENLCLRPDWDSVKTQCMIDILQAKWDQYRRSFPDQTCRRKSIIRRCDDYSIHKNKYWITDGLYRKCVNHVLCPGFNT